DCHSVISIYYSESMKTKTIDNSSFVLREKLLGDFVSTSQSTWLMGNRLLIIEPQQPLSPGTTYQLTAAVGPVDLDGLAYDPGTSPVIIEFTTAATVEGIPPEILASYPLNASTNQPNDSQSVVVFSKQIDVTTISIAVDLSNQTTSVPGDYDTNAGAEARHSGDRVFSFEHQSDGSDLNATLQLDVNTFIADTSLLHQFMVNPYTSSWQSMDMQRPQSIQFDQVAFGDFSPAANLANYQTFPLEVVAAPFALPADEVKVRVHQFDENHGEDYRLVEAESVTGAGIASFILDFTVDLFGTSTPVFEPESELLIGAYAERNGLRSTVSLHLDPDGEFESIAHDLIPPSLVQFGPPYGSFQSQFRSTLPIVRPYGVASEAIGEVIVDGDSRIVPLVSDDTFFIGNSFDPGLVTITDAPVDFELGLADAAGNPALSIVNAVAHFSGFVGGTDLLTSGGDMRVIALDKENLFPLGGATIHIEDVGGFNQDVGTSGSDGVVTFGGRNNVAQTVTIQRFGWQATTIIGVNASVISLPLTAETSSPISMSPQIGNLNSGISQISSNTLATVDGNADEFMAQDYDLDELFGDSVLSQINQPGWFVSFHEVGKISTNVSKNRYFRFVGLEEHVLVAPSTSSSAVVPVIEMAESSNVVASPADPHYLYDLSVTLATSFGLGTIEDSGASVSTVIPGLKGHVVVGAGDNDGAELEINLFNQAQLEGASEIDREGASPGDNIIINAYGLDIDGNEASGSSSLENVTDRLPSVPITVPGVPRVTSFTGAYPFTANYDATLAASGGMYEMTIVDNSAGAGVWNLIVMHSASGGGAVVLPSLLDDPGDITASIPLSTSGSVKWFSSAVAYEMGLLFSEIGFFFDAVRRDRISWAKSAFGPAVVSF
ncbi:Ig-like domain-containing protein, partial [Planctomycetota bacterium]|nr:Ig-like domain-containing protein [Planctomycetota bacterium]